MRIFLSTWMTPFTCNATERMKNKGPFNALPVYTSRLLWQNSLSRFFSLRVLVFQSCISVRLQQREGGAFCVFTQSQMLATSPIWKSSMNHWPASKPSSGLSTSISTQAKTYFTQICGCRHFSLCKLDFMHNCFLNRSNTPSNLSVLPHGVLQYSGSLLA